MAGYHYTDVYTPFPVEGLSEALGLQAHFVPLMTLIGGYWVVWPVLDFNTGFASISYAENMVDAL